MSAELSETGCYQMLRRLRWSKGAICPFCRQERITMHSKLSGTPRRRYLCLGCRRTFTDLTGTPFARTNLPLGTWFRCLQLIGTGQATSELARQLGVKWDTAARLQRRLEAGLRGPGLVRQLRDAMGKNRM